MILLFLFVLVVYGVLGVQIFKGALLYRCYHADDVAMGPLDVESGVCNPTFRAYPGESNSRAQLPPVCSRWGSRCRPGIDYVTRGSCDTGQLCQFYGGNPLHGAIGFDNILLAWATVFQTVTLEGWSEVMYLVYDAEDGGITAGFYFIPLATFGKS